jgi:transcriptional regulator with XRE-family HTH domain
MKITSQLPDEALLLELGRRLTAARLAQNLTQAALAERAGVAKRTVERLESGAVATQLSGFLRVCRALGLIEGLETLVPEPAASPIAQLKLQGLQRKRASKAKAPKTKKTKWTWGDGT